MNTIFVDFNNADNLKRIRLNTFKTIAEIDAKGIKLYNGLQLILDDNDELSIPGIVQFSEEEKIWVAIVDWEKLMNIYPPK